MKPIGWIKLHRKILESQTYNHLNNKQKIVMFTCLLLANHQKNKWEWGNKIYICKPGQFISSLKNIADKCGNDIKIQSVRSALLKLEKWQFLTNKSTKTGRLITITNWDTYQSDEELINKEPNKEPTKSQQRANKELTTNKNVKNVKKEKNEEEKEEIKKKIKKEKKSNFMESNKSNPNKPIKIFKELFPKEYIKEKEMIPSIKDFIDHRNEIKCHLTERAIKMIVNKCKQFNPEEVVIAFQDSVIGGYKGVFPKKKYNGKGYNKPKNKTTAFDNIKVTEYN